MNLVNLVDIYNKINNCPRKMGSLHILCILGDAHKSGKTWVNVLDLAEQSQTNISNVRNAIAQMVDERLIEKRYINKEGQLTESATRQIVVRLVSDCNEALGGTHEACAA